MQKLEEIMRAEEHARHIIADARERADTLIRETEAAAKANVATAREEASREAAELRENRLAEAQREADAERREIETANEALLAASGERLGDAVRVVIERLQG